MRRRRGATPRLEAMEERAVPSFLGMNMPSSVTADFKKLGHGISSYATDVKNYVESLNQHRTGQSQQTTWATRATTAHKTSNNLFGIPWLKI